MTTRVSRYQPPESKLWQGRTDSPEGASFFQIIKSLDLFRDKIPVYHAPRFGLLGFCCDEGIRRNFGRTGAAFGPSCIREILAKLPVQKRDLICFDVGDITCTDGDLESSQHKLAEAVAILLQHGITPIVLGGGHELAFGHYQGIATQFAHENLGIVNFDAHFDMRPLLSNNLGSSGTPFLQIANAHEHTHRRFDYNCIGIQYAGNTRQLFETAKNFHTQIMLADEMHQSSMDKRIDFINRIINDNQIIYLSLCLDVFAAAYAPGVSAPQPFGLTPWQIVPLIRQLADSGKVVSYDLAELSPQYDSDYRTAKLAAQFIHEIIHHHQIYAAGKT